MKKKSTAHQQLMRDAAALNKHIKSLFKQAKAKTISSEDAVELDRLISQEIPKLRERLGEEFEEMMKAAQERHE